MASPHSLSLPIYSPPGPSPEYSSEPTCDEQTLQHTPRLTRALPTGTFTQTSGKVTVALSEQEDSAKIPSYCQRGLVQGTIHLEDRELISDVALKIQGKLDSLSTEGGGNCVPFLNDHYALWKPKDRNTHCPSLIAFSCMLPLTYNHGSSKVPLPPSFYAYYPGPPVLYVQSHYAIIIHIQRARHHKVGFFTKRDTVKIPFKYYPRTRAHRPILFSSPSFFSTIKTSPEEWHQVFSAIKTKFASQMEPMNAHLLTPVARTYGLQDRIPFHVQIAGPPSSLQQFFTARQNKSQCSVCHIRVFLQRTVVVKLSGEMSTRNSILGEGQLDEIPPLACAQHESDDTIWHVNWQGEVRWTENVSVGGFSSGNVEVKDSIVLEIEPSKHYKHGSPFFSLRLSVPIRFVTDSYIEMGNYDRAYD